MTGEDAARENCYLYTVLRLSETLEGLKMLKQCGARRGSTPDTLKVVFFSSVQSDRRSVLRTTQNSGAELLERGCF